MIQLITKTKSNTKIMSEQPIQDIVIERWLGYETRTRNVVYQEATTAFITVEPVKNILIQWETPDVDIMQKYTYLGIEEMNPWKYIARFGASLVSAANLPPEVHEFVTPVGEVLAVDAGDYMTYPTNDTYYPTTISTSYSVDQESIACYSYSSNSNDYFSNNNSTNYCNYNIFNQY